MSETHTEQKIDYCQPSVTEIDTPRKVLIEVLEIKSINTLKSWCKLWDIAYKAEFTPDEVAKLQHVKHWLQVKKLSTAQYKAMIDDRQPSPEVNQQHGRYTSVSDQTANHSADVKQAIQQRYGQTISSLSKPLAEAFWQQLDLSVMKEIAILASRQEQSLIESSLLNNLSNEEKENLFFLTSEDDGEIPLLSASYEP